MCVFLGLLLLGLNTHSIFLDTASYRPSTSLGQTSGAAHRSRSADCPKRSISVTEIGLARTARRQYLGRDSLRHRRNDWSLVAALPGQWYLCVQIDLGPIITQPSYRSDLGRSGAYLLFG